MIDEPSIDALRHAAHGDPFGVLGLHADGVGQSWLRAWIPGARRVDACTGDGESMTCTLPRRHADGLFEGRYPASAPADYRLRVTWPDGSKTLLDDPYRFGAVLGELDVWLLGEGKHLRPYEVLGASVRTLQGAAGTAFAVWAPNASRVSVVGDFNQWDGRRHPMRLRRECGVWEIFLPDVAIGARYKYEIRSGDGRVLPLKADPYALRAELRPATASVVAQMPPPLPASDMRRQANALDAPMSIYEVHAGSWRRKPEEGDRWLSWDELAAELVPYVSKMGFTHIELMPVTEHPFDGSWGYQPLGLYAPTSRFGEPDGLRRLIDACHAAGIGLIVDWVPAHFPADAHGLAEFDGTPLYEHADPREGFHQDWNTLIYNFGRAEVANFLVGNALYWLERYGVDGLRVDAVASMLYRDYSRKAGEWVPNEQGGRENLEAIAFLKRANEVVGVERTQAVTLAEESTAFPAVSRPVYAGGLGFHYKWNMGWMHDTLQYMARDPVHRRYHHGEITFSMVYAFNENFVLPLSHDEVVHGKGSMLAKMPGDAWQQFANLRAYYGFMWGHPGKKLLFMGSEFAQGAEWNHDKSLDWHQLDHPLHAGMQRLVSDLNHFYRQTPALYQRDFDASGFEWIDHGDAERSVLSFIRRGEDANALVVVVCNFTPTVQRDVRIGVPHAGIYTERINTDSEYYGGSNVGSELGAVDAVAEPWHGKSHSLCLTLPPLATLFLTWQA